MKLISYLQKIGASLMIPVAVLPAAAVLLGIGYWIDPVAWGGNSTIAAMFIQTGGAIIDNMPILFAIGVAFGMSKDKHGAAALAGLVGFLVVTKLCSTASVSQIMNIPADQVSPAFGKINNQFVGILVGVLSAAIYNKYSKVELHKALSFFSGRRLVPILTSVAMLFVSAALIVVWPLLFSGLVTFGEAIAKMGPVGAGLYGFFNRLLIPTGLHHALNSVFWFDVAGINDIPNFLGGEKSIQSGVGIPGVTGMYQAGYFPIMMFGLVGAALAFVHTAKKKNRAKIASIMLAAGFASFLTGVTEPIEFAFMFVAPWLYLLHAVFAGISLFIASTMQWIAGFGFSAGLIDLVLSTRNPLAVRWYMLIPQGIVFFFVYYLSFKFIIIKFKLKTPGREDDEEPVASSIAGETTGSLAEQVAAACGGLDNIVSIDSCITRLRLEVKNNDVDTATLKRLGSKGVIKPSKTTVQVIFGAKAEKIADELIKMK